MNGGDFTKKDASLTKVFAMAMRLQFVLGLLLYFVFSPITQAGFEDFGGAMKNSGLRYWMVEHLFAMIVGIALIEIGAKKSKKAATSKGKFKAQAIFFTIAMIVMLSRIPFDQAGRLFRGL